MRIREATVTGKLVQFLWCSLLDISHPISCILTHRHFLQRKQSNWVSEPEGYAKATPPPHNLDHKEITQLTPCFHLSAGICLQTATFENICVILEKIQVRFLAMRDVFPCTRETSGKQCTKIKEILPRHWLLLQEESNKLQNMTGSHYIYLQLLHLLVTHVHLKLNTW